MPELWELYDGDKRPTGKTMLRGQSVPEGYWHIVVGIWTITADGRLLLTCRHPDKPWGLQWENTGGSVLAGEDSLHGALRELREETGLTAESWTHLMDFLSTPGFSDERISLYLARELSVGESHPDDDEFLNVVRVPLAQLVADIMAGEVNDAKTVCAVLMADRIING